jgi:hypothetical protein
VARLGEVELDFVNVAPPPCFAGLDGFHDGVFRFVEMLGGMSIFWGVAAVDFAAFQAQAEVDPGVANLHAFFAAFGAGSDGANLVHVRAGFHFVPPIWLQSIFSIANPSPTEAALKF